MPATIPEGSGGRPPSLWRRIGWFVTLYVVGVGSVGLVSLAIRWWIK